MLRDRYDSGMTTKIAVSLPDELVDNAKAAVADGRAASVSAYVAGAMRAYETTDSLDKLLDEMDAKYGPPSAEAYVWAREQLGVDEGDAE